MKSSNDIDELVQSVLSGKRYGNFYPDLVRRIAEKEIDKRRSKKEALKQTRSKLHQIGGAYTPKPIEYEKWKTQLMDIPTDLDSDQFKQYCLQMMEHHTSTIERLDYLTHFYEETLGDLGVIHSFLDLGCGLNPLSVAWMPHASSFQYFACDIYTDLIKYLKYFLRYIHAGGEAWLCDLTDPGSLPSAEVAFLFKTLPVLEQLEKNSSIRLLDRIQSQYILVSFPSHSIGGKAKGMIQHYSEWFSNIIEGKNWHIKRFDFPGELVYRIQK